MLVGLFCSPSALLEPSWRQVAIFIDFRRVLASLGSLRGLSWEGLALSLPPLGPIWAHPVALFFSLLAALVFPPFLSKIHCTHFRGCYFQASLLPRPDGRASLGRAWGLSCHSPFLGWLRADGRRWLPQRGFQLNKILVGFTGIWLDLVWIWFGFVSDLIGF